MRQGFVGSPGDTFVISDARSPTIQNPSNQMNQALWTDNQRMANKRKFGEYAEDDTNIAQAPLKVNHATNTIS